MVLRGQSVIIYIVWTTLVVAAVAALFVERWSMSFVAVATLIASILPAALAARFRIHLPLPFLSFVVLFIFASLFLGEALDFYGRYWWWDIALHKTSSVGFGLVGFIFILMLFEGDRFAAPAWALALLSWFFAIAVGSLWEVFEFGMDSLFGFNMQKSGLLDTMGDLIANLVGGAIGALSGLLYLAGQERGGLAWLIGEFVRRNARFFRRNIRR